MFEPTEDTESVEDSQDDGSSIEETTETIKQKRKTLSQSTMNKR